MIRTINYTGNYKQFQQEGSRNGNKNYQIDGMTLNNYQQFLYNRALYGLSVYTKEDLMIMSKSKRNRILKVYKRSQTVLNLWKQELVNRKTNDFLLKMFPNSRVTQDFVNEGNFTDESYVNTTNFKDLGVKTKDIIDKLLDEGILPKNYYELITEPDVR